MNAEHLYQIYQIKPGKPAPVYIDPNDPKGIKCIQEILRKEDAKKEVSNEKTN